MTTLHTTQTQRQHTIGLSYDGDHARFRDVFGYEVLGYLCELYCIISSRSQGSLVDRDARLSLFSDHETSCYDLYILLRCSSERCDRCDVAVNDLAWVKYIPSGFLTEDASDSRERLKFGSASLSISDTRAPYFSTTNKRKV
jgi:hypothetical protein